MAFNREKLIVEIEATSEGSSEIKDVSKEIDQLSESTERYAKRQKDQESLALKQIEAFERLHGSFDNVIDINRRLSGSIESLNRHLETSESESRDLANNNSTLESSYTRLAIAVTGLNQAYQLAISIYNNLRDSISKLTEAYGIQESAEMGLANTLRLTGQYSRQSFEDFKSFASKLQETSVIGDEVTLAFLKIAKAQGLSNDQSKRLLLTTADLSAGLGKDLNSSFDQLLKTFGGYPGELGEIMPQLQEFTKAQLQSGAAIDYVAERLRGQAKVQTETFQGRSIQAMNAFGDLLESLGRLLVDVFDLKQVANDMKDFWNGLINQAENFRRKILQLNLGKLRDDLEKVALVIGLSLTPSIIKVTQAMIQVLIPLALVSAKILAISAAISAIILAFDLLARNTNNLGNLWDTTVAAMTTTWNAFLKSVLSGVNFLFGFFREYHSRISKLGFLPDFIKNYNSRLSQLHGVLSENAQKTISDLTEKMKEGAEGTAKAFESLGDQGAVGSLIDIFKNLSNLLDPDIKGKVEDLNSELGNLGPNITRKVKLEPEGDLGTSLSSVGASLTKVFGDGASKLGGAISSAASSAAVMWLAAFDALLDAIQSIIDFFPNLLNKIGGVFSSLTDLPKNLSNALSGAAEALQTFISDFVSNLQTEIPKILDTLIGIVEKIPESLGEMISKLPETLPRFISSLVSHMPKLAIAFVKHTAIGIPKVVVELIKMAPQIGAAIVLGILEGIKEIFTSLGNLFTLGSKSFSDAITSTFESLTGKTSEIFSINDLDDAVGLTSFLNSAAISLKSAWALIWENFLKPFIDKVGEVFRWIDENIFRPFIDGIKRAWSFISEDIIMPLWNYLKDKVLGPLEESWKSVWGWIESNIWEPFIRGLNFFSENIKEFLSKVAGIGKKIWDGFETAARISFRFIEDLGRKIWDGFWNSVKILWDKIRSIGRNIFSGFWDSIRGIWDNFVNMGKNIWSGFWNGVVGFWDKLLDIGKQIAAGFNSAIKGVTGGGILDEIGRRLPKFAHGGLVSENLHSIGTSNDRILGLFDPNEYIIRPEAVRSFGIDNLNKINRGMMPTGENKSVSLSLTIENFSIMTSKDIDEEFTREDLLNDFLDELKRRSLDGEFVLSRAGIQ